MTNALLVEDIIEEEIEHYYDSSSNIKRINLFLICQFLLVIKIKTVSGIR